MISLRGNEIPRTKAQCKKPASGSLGPERLSTRKHIYVTRTASDLNETYIRTHAYTQLDQVACMQTHTHTDFRK